MIPHDEAPSHEFEAARGLPQALPRGERLLWQGSPDWRLVARDALHLRLFAGYFAVLLAWRVAIVVGDGGDARALAMALVGSLPLAGLALGLIALMAWLVARTSVYTITDQRVVMRIGVVLSITFNLPCSQIESAGLKTRPDGSGEITLTLAATDSIAYLHLWPHARPWRLKRAEPMLRGLPQAAAVAALLAEALAGSTDRPLAAQATAVRDPLVERPAAVSPQALAA